MIKGYEESIMKEIRMREISKADWKLFREKIPVWQEHYMEKLVQEYVILLTDKDKTASAKFWTLEKRIKEDIRKPGVLISMRKPEAIRDIIMLIHDGAISLEDLKDFSDDLQETVTYIVNRDRCEFSW